MRQQLNLDFGRMRPITDLWVFHTSHWDESLPIPDIGVRPG